MRVALLCATRRGRTVLEHLARKLPAGSLVVFSFREEPWEPPFLESIRELASSTGNAFFEARDVGASRSRSVWESAPTDLMLAVNWRYVVPRGIHGRCSRGAFVFHDSLLPAYRGYSPTVWAIIHGARETGATLFAMSDEVDSGDIVDQERVEIGPEESIAEVTERVTAAYVRILDRQLDHLLEGTAPRSPQDHARATYVCKRLPEDDRIDWSAPTRTIFDLVRAVTRPYPGAFTTLAGRTLRVWSAQQLSEGARYVGRVPGRVVEVRPGSGVVVLTGDGALQLTEVQLEGEQAARADLVIRSLRETVGR